MRCPSPRTRAHSAGAACCRERGPWWRRSASRRGSPRATAFGAESKVGGTIDFLSWQGYDSPKSLGPWLKANGVKLKPTYIATHDDIQAKILALHGGKGYDIITYYQGYKQLYDQLKILTPLDEKKIPNIKGMLPFFKSNYRGFWVKNGVRTAVPMYWGALGLVYDSKAMPTAPTSYDILFTKKLKGAVTVDDDPVGVYTLAGHTLKINVATMTQAQFDKISAYLEKLVKQSKGVAPSYGDCAKRIADGDAVIGWPGWAAQVGFAAGSGNKNVRFVLPKEGGYAYCDSWAIPISNDNPDATYGYINNAISPKVNAAAAEEQILGGVTVRRSRQVPRQANGLALRLQEPQQLLRQSAALRESARQVVDLRHDRQGDREVAGDQGIVDTDGR